MNYSFIQQIISDGGNGIEGIVQFFVFLIFIVAMVIKSVLGVQKEQKNQQNKQQPRRPAQQSQNQAQKTSAQATSERVEQFLESILQPKRVTQDNKSVSSVQKSQQKPHPSLFPHPVAGTISQPSQKHVITKKPHFISQPSKYPVSNTSPGSRIFEMPTIETQLEEPPESTPKEVKKEKLKIEKIAMSSEKDLSGILPSFSDTDDLKKAILYFEILGKPISMRESSRTIY